MHVPGPRPLARSHRCEAGPGLRYFSKTSQVILTQAFHGNPQRILGSTELPGLSELRDSGRSARELGQGSALPVSQWQRTSHRRPGARGEELAARDPTEDVCLHLPPGAGAAPTWLPGRRDRLRGGAPQPVLTGAEAMGGAVGSWLLPPSPCPCGESGEGRGRGRKGNLATPGTVCPERQRLAVTTTTAHSNPALQAWPAEPRGSARAVEPGLRHLASGKPRGQVPAHIKANVY